MNKKQEFLEVYNVFFLNKKLGDESCHKVKATKRERVEKMFYLQARQKGRIFKKDIIIRII